MTEVVWDFSTARLRRMFRLSLERGYSPLVFGGEEKVSKPFILWRHDIDLELPAVLTMAEIEAELGMRATYFFMTRSWFYNLFSLEGIQVVQRIKQLGHLIGIHCDLQIGRGEEVAEDFVQQRVVRDFQLVDTTFPGLFDRVVSFHNPPLGVLRRHFKDFYNVYQPKFFGQIKYLSDSNRHWRDGYPERWFDVERHPRLSILLHPVIWSYPGRTMPEAMTAFLQRRTESCRRMLVKDEVWV